MSTEKPEQDLLGEQVCSAWRPRGADGTIGEHPAWADLSEDARLSAFDDCILLRRIEAALHPLGLSSTGQALLDRITGGDDGG